MAGLLASLGEPGPDDGPLLAFIALLLAVAIGWPLALLARALWRRLTVPPDASVPVDEWRRRGLHVQRSQGVIEFQAGQRCPLCHVEHAPTSEAARCDACGALFHLLCARELGGCSTLGCQGETHRVNAVRLV